MSKPKIRFKRFTDDWEQRKLGTLCSLITKGTTPKDKSGNGEVNFVKVENIDIDNGEITSTSKISIAGTLGRVSVVKSSILPANINQALAILRINEGYIPYLTTVLKGRAVEDFIRRNPTIGAQPNLSLEQVNNLDISYPNYDEQVRIGQYFSNLDNLITLHQRKYDKLVNIKKSMIEKMFPQNGACVPEIRFKGFTDDWEQRKLGEVGSVSMCRRIFKEQTSESGDIPFYKIGTFGGQADAYISRELFAEYRSKYPYPKEGDILISASGSIGRTVEFTGKNEYFQDSNIVWLSHDDRLDNTFLKYFYSVVKWAGIEGSTIKRLYNDNILNTVISMPSVAEQRKIGTFFKKLDNLITLHQRKIEKLKNIKKSCLEKMFV